MFQVVFTPGQQDKCFLCGQIGHLAATCEGKAKRKAGEFDEKGNAEVVPKKPYQVAVKLNLCNYLLGQMQEIPTNFHYLCVIASY